MTADIEIRPAAAGDVEAVAALNAALFAEDAGTRDPFTDQGWPARGGRAYFDAMLADQDRCACWLATSGGEPVGYLAARRSTGSETRPGEVAHLESMYVGAGFRGQGVGERLVRAFLAWAGLHGAVRAQVNAYATNERAIAFYRRAGFAPFSLALEARLPAVGGPPAPSPDSEHR